MFWTRKPPAPASAPRPVIGNRDPGRAGSNAVGITVAVLGFAIAFPLVAKLSGMDIAVVTATLAALPGILYAALNRNL